MLKNRVFHTKFGKITGGDKATTEDVKRYFAYRAEFFWFKNTFGLQLPNHGRDAKMAYEADELFSDELLKGASNEIKQERKNYLYSEIHKHKEELKQLEA